jgi:hypothetical protein
VGISGLPLGNPGTKSHLDVAPMESCRVYYKGEGGGFPQVRAVVNIVCPSCPWLVLAPKVFQLCTNHFVLVLCRSMWKIEACQIFHPGAPTHPSTPIWCYESGSVPQLLILPLFSIWDSHLSHSRSWECVTLVINSNETYCYCITWHFWLVSDTCFFEIVVISKNTLDKGNLFLNIISKIGHE